MGPLFILSGPSGVGKTTVLHQIIQKADLPLRQSVSCTTRPVRSGEIPDKDYHFMDREDFAREIASGGFLEHAEVHSELYGTLLREVTDWRVKGFGVVLVIDVQGASQVRSKIKVDCSIFLDAPSEVLRQRLDGRGTETVEVVERRLKSALRERSCATGYTCSVTNTNLGQAVAEITDLWRSFFPGKKSPA